MKERGTFAPKRLRESALAYYAHEHLGVQVAAWDPDDQTITISDWEGTESVLAWRTVRGHQVGREALKHAAFIFRPVSADGEAGR
jgi:hypothetical protein